MEKNEIKLDDLSTTEKYVLRLVGDDPHYKPIGSERTSANYLASQKVIEYAGSGRYKLTDIGTPLYIERMLFFKEKEVEKKEEVLNTN